MTRQPIPTTPVAPRTDEPGRNALVLGGRREHVERRELVEQTDVELSAAHVLAVTYSRDAEGWLDDWEEHVGGPPRDVAVLAPGEFTRAASAARPASTTHALPGRGTIESIDDPLDLATLGERARGYVERWANDGHRTVVVFETVTALLDRVPGRTAFGFLHLLTHRTRATGGLGWYYLDPRDHDDVTVRTLATLFDEVVDPCDERWRCCDHR